MKVDIVITTYRSAKKLEVCLKTIVERTKNIEYTIRLLANDPNEEIKKVIYNSMFIDDIMYTDRIDPIYSDSNDGSFSSNNNDAASEGDAEYILFLNDDVEPINENWLYNMVNILDSDPKAGVVGALLLYPDKKTIQHCGVFFSRRTNNLPFHMLYKQSIDKVGAYISVSRYYQAVTGACMLVRRSDFEAVGGFSEDYYYSFEDIDLCLKIGGELDKRSVFCSESVLIHHEGISGTQPKLNENITAFRKNCTGKYFDDYEFYMRDPKFMIYRSK